MNYDLTIIGAGWAGFNAALKAKELGLKVCLIEKSHIGGTCLNAGCIPTKALIHSAKVYSISKKAESFGIEGNNPNPNFAKIQERKDTIVKQLQKGMQFLLKGIDYINAEAKILSNQEIQVGDQNIKTKFILIACGSMPIELKNLKFDGKKVVSSDDILKIKETPKNLLVIGGGVIGCEFASLFSNLGAQVSIVEMMPQLLPGVDNEVARKIESLLKKKRIKISTNTDATTVDLSNYDLVLLCIGRTPNAGNLELEKIGVKLEKNKIIVDDYLKTSVDNIYAAGDCTGKTMLAHYAAYQGTVAAENIAKPANSKKADNTNVPSCIFTDPEIASVGLSEEDAKNKSIDIKINKFDFLASGMARIQDETDGFVKIISDSKTDQVLGASIIGPKATELIAVLALAVSTHLKSSQIKDTIFAHPTLSESIEEALKH